MATPVTSIENNFKRGLITEATGLNFPENAATDCSNVTFTTIGDVLRREGIDYEVGYKTNDLSSRLGNAISTYVWNNAGGDGSTKFLVVQNGGTLYFFNISDSTETDPLSAQLLTGSAGNIPISDFAVTTFDPSIECQYTDGNGYLFVFNANCDPIYVTYSVSLQQVSATVVNIQIRDFYGMPESIPYNYRPSTLSAEHNYNLINQGWASGNPWSSTSSTSYALGTTGSFTFTIGTGLSVVAGQTVIIYYTGSPVLLHVGYGYLYPGTAVASGNVTSYTSASGALVVDIVGTNYPQLAGLHTSFTSWNIIPDTFGPTTTFLSDEGVYPSNADVWWYFKDNTGTFNPSTTASSVTLSVGRAPQGHFLLNAFNLNRSAISGVSGLTSVTTTQRPTTGCWFQGRIWYAGTQASQDATGDASFYSWSENIYFSQVNVGTDTNFGNCFQNNDPTAEDLFSILPTDGGVIQIQGSGLIKKLFPIQNGLLVFAQNGVWFITGSTGIGFEANDYTVTKISSVEILSGHSFVDVLGLPYFWNLEGIYRAEPMGNGGGLTVAPITIESIKSFYDDIPNISKKYARGDYDPISYTIQWIYKSTVETSVTDRYAFDSILNLNVYTKAFFPYVVDNTVTSINSIAFVQPIETPSSPTPTFKYLASTFTSKYLFTFADEHDNTYTDWSSTTPSNYTSYFITGYQSPNMFSPSTMDRSKGTGKFQTPYIYTYSRVLDIPSSYYLQTVWDFGVALDSNRWSSQQQLFVNELDYGMIVRRSRVRGQGLVMQIKISSVDGMPFDLIGWTLSQSINRMP